MEDSLPVVAITPLAADGVEGLAQPEVITVEVAPASGSADDGIMLVEAAAGAPLTDDAASDLADPGDAASEPRRRRRRSSAAV